MISIKSTATDMLRGNSFGASITGFTSNGPSRSLNTLNPSLKGACPTGNCDGASTALNSLTGSNSNSNANSGGGSNSRLSGILSSVETNSLWRQLVCGELPTRRNPVNNKREIDSSAIWLRSTNCTLQGLMGLLKVDNGKFKLDSNEAKKRLNSALGSTINNMVNDPSSQLSSIMSDRLNTTPSKAIMMIGQAKKLVSNNDVSSAKGFTELLKKATGSDLLIDFLDIEAEMAILDHLLDQTIKLGIPQAIDIVLGKIEDDKAKRRLILKNLRSAAMSSDLEYIRKAVDYVGVDGVISRVPNIIEIITQYYRKESRSTDRDDELLTDLLNTLELIDGNWIKVDRGGELVNNLGPFMIASRDCKSLFNRNEVLRTLVAISDNLRVRDIVAVARFNCNYINVI